MNANQVCRAALVAGVLAGGAWRPGSPRPAAAADVAEAAPAPAAAPAPTEHESLAVARRVAAKGLGEVARGHYTHVLLLQALAELYRASGDPCDLQLARRHLMPTATGKRAFGGNFLTYRCGGNGAAILLRTGHLPEASQQVKATAELTHEKSPRSSEGIITAPWCVKGDKVFIDTAFAVTPFLVTAGLHFDDPAWVRDGFEHTAKLYNVLSDAETGLVHQGRGFTGKTPISPVYWSRGNGWGLVALAAMVDYLPDGEMLDRSRELLRDHLVACLKVQDDRGMWRQVMDLHTDASYVETSGTGMILYALATAIEHGVLPPARKRDLTRGLAGYLAYIGPDGSVSHTCRGCLCPGDGTARPYLAKRWKLNDTHAFGPAVLAFAKAHKVGITRVRGRLGSRMPGHARRLRTAAADDKEDAMSQTPAAGRYRVERLAGGKPVITRRMFADAGHDRLGSNINGPSVIRVPDWIPPARRANPKARYYLYFAHHHGRFIRMAWAVNVAGPYTLHGLDGPDADGARGVLALGPDGRIDLAHGLALKGHIASPDVHVDGENRRIRMYFHGPADHRGSNVGQKSFAAQSADGLDFNAGIEPVILGLAYFRVFDYGGATYAIASRGALYKAPPEPFTPPGGFDFRGELWHREGGGNNDNPFQHDLDRDPARDPTGRLRHSAVRVAGEVLEVFHSRVGDRPERVLLTTVDLTAGAFTRWDPTYPPAEILRPELEWEGAALPLKPSTGGSAAGVRQLRDPYVFEDADGRLYLFYTGAGEEAIGVVRLVPNR